MLCLSPNENWKCTVLISTKIGSAYVLIPFWNLKYTGWMGARIGDTRLTRTNAFVIFVIPVLIVMLMLCRRRYFTTSRHIKLEWRKNEFWRGTLREKTRRGDLHSLTSMKSTTIFTHFVHSPYQSRVVDSVLLIGCHAIPRDPKKTWTMGGFSAISRTVWHITIFPEVHEATGNMTVFNKYAGRLKCR